MREKIEKILEYLDKLEDTREQMLDISHRSIRKSSSAMAALHRGDMEEFKEKKQEIEDYISKLNEILESDPQFRGHGALIAAHREFSELIITDFLMRGNEIPDPEDLDVLYEGYAQALAESAGELRRHLLNLLREDEVEEAEEIHDRMEKLFDLLEQFDYPDSILPGMKHRRDTARKTLEDTRADITRAVRERKLEDTLSRTEGNMED